MTHPLTPPASPPAPPAASPAVPPCAPSPPSALSTPSAATRRSPPARPWLYWGASLSIACLALRLANLRALPIFGDESIYLRWAQVIRGEGVTAAYQHWHLWVSLADPKPPLHFWLIALFYPWFSDPLISARLISVLAGVVGIPAILGMGRELGELMVQRTQQVSGRGLGVIAAILAILCPFMAFYQRLATADALFVSESLFIVWLSLRWARLTLKNARFSGLLTAITLGIAIGAGLLTRQGVSYTLCAMPAIAWLTVFFRMRRNPATSMAPNPRPPVPWLRGMIQLAIAALVAAALWTPYLTAELFSRARENNPQLAGNANSQPSSTDLLAEIKRRIMYQKEFTQAGSSRWTLIKRNAFLTFIPDWNEDAHPDSGWLPLYMTPLIFIMGLAGLVYAAIRQRFVFIILFLWALVMLAPIVLLVENIYSRYVLAGVPPLLLAGALLLGDTMATLPRKWGWILAVGLWAVLLAMPVMEIGRQILRWQDQTLTWNGRARGDRYQYLTGWTAGRGTERAIAYLRETARNLAHANPQKPMVVITTNAWGTPADAVWVYLSREPNVQLYFTDARTILRPGVEAGTYLLKEDKWLFTPERPVRLPADAPVYFVCNEPVHADVDVPAGNFYKNANPGLRAPRKFAGIRAADGDRGEGAAVFLVPRPGSTAPAAISR